MRARLTGISDPWDVVGHEVSAYPPNNACLEAEIEN